MHYLFPSSRADLLTHGDYNVFGVEWPTLAQFPFFLRAGENAVKVGEYAGEFLGDLVALTGLDPAQVHLVGHSYGSQAAGQMGRSARALTGGVPVGRVTALEPAFPWFRWHDASLVVGAGDAEFVDVWHTNSGKLAEVRRLFPLPVFLSLTKINSQAHFLGNRFLKLSHMPNRPA